MGAQESICEASRVQDNETEVFSRFSSARFCASARLRPATNGIAREVDLVSADEKNFGRKRFTACLRTAEGWSWK
jgi:hypothetical protein